MRHLILLNLKTKVISAVQVAINKKKKRLGRLLVLGLFFLTLVFILAGCQGFLDDYSYNPVGAVPINSNQ